MHIERKVEMQKNTNMAMDLYTWTDDEVELRFKGVLVQNIRL